MPSALIKFTQGANTDLAGRALQGDNSDVVVVSNDDNTGVTHWKYELLYVPPGSAVPLVVQGPGATSTLTFGPPDISGSYRVRLTVTDSLSNTDIDIRNFCFAFPAFGFVAPPFQGDPKSLPLVGAGSKPNEMNLDGQPYGWDGTQDTSLLYQALKQLDTLAGAGPGIGAGTHAQLRQLIHLADDEGPFEGFVSGAYREQTPAADPFPTFIGWYTNVTKAFIIMTETIGYNANKTIATDTWRAYDAASSFIFGATDTITYSGIFEISRVRTYFGPV
jgi:hypothetical protein